MVYPTMTSLLILLCSALSYSISSEENTATAIENRQKIECHTYDSITVVIRDGTDNYIDVLVINSKYLRSKCIYDSLHASFEAKQQAESFYIDFRYPYLFLDSGTSPDPRELTIVDVVKKMTVLDTSYSSPIEFVGRDTVCFWTERNDTSFLQCKELGDYTSKGLGCAIDDQVYFNLRTHGISNTGRSRCAPRQ